MEGFFELIVFGVVHANAPMKLIVQTYFFIGNIFISRQLNAIHAQVPAHGTGLIGIFGVHLGHGDKCPAVHRPTFNLWKFINGRFLPGHGASPAVFHGQCRERSERRAEIARWFFQEIPWIAFKLNYAFDLFQGIPKKKRRALKRAINIAHRLKWAAFNPFKKNGRALTIEDLTVNFSYFQIRVHFFLNSQEHPVAF